MSQILNLVSEYMECGIKRYSHNIYGIDCSDDSYSSLRIFTDTDSAYHYSEQKYYNIESFARNVIGLSDSELEKLIPNIETNSFLTLLNNISVSKNTGLSLQDVVSKPGYNKYLSDERNISEETAKYFGLEISYNDDIYIPLYDLQKFQRIGSLVRNSSSNHKRDRYRTLMVGTNDKPACWPGFSLKNVNPNTVFLIMEGAFSAQRVYQVCLHKTTNVIPLATLTNNFNEELFYLLHDFPIILLPDTDSGGDMMAEKFKKDAKKYNYTKYEIYRTYSNNGQPLALDDATDDELKGLFNSIYQTTKFDWRF